jgi:uncharacterized protein YfaS (alpha-2-macroglobulin family)
MPVINGTSHDKDVRRPPRISRNCTVSTKLTKTEFAEIERLAEEHGQWLSEWVRNVLLEATEEQKTPRHHAAFIELQALRLLLVNALEPLLRGDRMTADQFKEMLRYVKANKRKAAEDTLASYAERSTDQI